MKTMPEFLIFYILAESEFDFVPQLKLLHRLPFLGVLSGRTKLCTATGTKGFFTLPWGTLLDSRFLI